MQLHQSFDQLESRGVRAVAIAQEDVDLGEFATFYGAGFDAAPRFEAVADLNRAKTGRLDHTTSYLVDPNGKILQVFPMTVRFRAAWPTIFAEIDRLTGKK